jgi:hypothetical protein
MPAAREGKDAVPRPGRRRPPWALAALFATLLAARPVAAQAGGDRPELWFSQDARGQQGKVRWLRLRPNVKTQVYLHVRSEAGSPGMLKAVLFSGKKPLPLASVPVKVARGITPVIFGKAPPPKGVKPAPLPLAETSGPLSVCLFDAKGQKLDEVRIGVATPREYVAVDAVLFDPREQADGKKNVVEVRLSARPNFTGEPARVELVLPPERIPDLLPGQKKEGSYSGLLRPGRPLVLRAENLKFRETYPPKQGLFYLTIDGYPRAFSFVSGFAAEKFPSQPHVVTPPVIRLTHPKFAKPGAKLPVVLEVDNMPTDAVCTLEMFRNKDLALVSREDVAWRFTGDRAATVLFNLNGPGGALVFDSRVTDHTAELDTKGLYGVRYLAAGMIPKSKAAAAPASSYISLLDSTKISHLGLTVAIQRIVQPVLITKDGPTNVTLELDLPTAAAGRPFQPGPAEGLPLIASATDPTSVVRAVFFVGKPLTDGKIPPDAARAEGIKLSSKQGYWIAELPIPSGRDPVLDASVLLTNGLGESTVKTIAVQLANPPPALDPVNHKSATAGTSKWEGIPAPPSVYSDNQWPVTLGGSVNSANHRPATLGGTVYEGGRPVPNVPVTLIDDKGNLKNVTRTDAAGEFRFDRVPPGVYTLIATQSPTRARGQALVALPAGAGGAAVVSINLVR